ncbi:MAG: hypothetical protein GYB53_20345 [Rhodobacteraceae bacterium]|nr:hypothetical protein [Paracoccaceae bacterium]
MPMTTHAISHLNANGLTNLEFILQALTAVGRLPCARPCGELPAHFTVGNMENLYVERHGKGWVANLQFTNVPKGLPDCAGTPSAHPFEDAHSAFMAGMALVCQVATGSAELPFDQVGDNLVVVADH